MSGLSGQVVGSSGMNEERYDHMDRKSFDSIRIEIAGAEDLNEIRNSHLTIRMHIWIIIFQV